MFDWQQLSTDLMRDVLRQSENATELMMQSKAQGLPADTIVYTPPKINPDQLGWEDFLDNGFITFTNRDGKPIDAEKIKRFTSGKGIGQVIDDLLNDEQLSADFIHALKTRPLTINLGGSNSYDPQENQLHLKGDTGIYLDVESGKAVPISNHSVTMHELIHYIDLHDEKKLQRSTDDLEKHVISHKHQFESFAVDHTDRIMTQKYGEPSRHTYVAASQSAAGALIPMIGFYKEGETFADKVNLQDLPMMNELFPNIVMETLANFDSTDKAERKAAQQFFDGLGEKYENYLTNHGSAGEREDYAHFKQNNPDIMRNYDKALNKLHRYSKDNFLSDKEQAKLGKLSEKLEGIDISIKPVRSFGEDKPEMIDVNVNYNLTPTQVEGYGITSMGSPSSKSPER